MLGFRPEGHSGCGRMLPIEIDTSIVPLGTAICETVTRSTAKADFPLSDVQGKRPPSTRTQEPHPFTAEPRTGLRESDELVRMGLNCRRPVAQVSNLVAAGRTPPDGPADPPWRL
jgi:hypothetical protein